MANENSETVEIVKEAPAQEAEKLLKQSEVNSLIGRAKAEAQEKARRQAEAEYQSKLAELEAQKHTAVARGQDPTEIDIDKVSQQVQQRLQAEMQQRQFEQHMQQVADTYEDKISKGGEEYEDYETAIKDFNPTQFPQIVYLASQLDNTADVIYELAKNPEKLATIDSLAQRSPELARKSLKKMGMSIDANKSAVDQEAGAYTPAPLDRLTPSNKKGSNGRLSVSDLRSQPWLRG